VTDASALVEYLLRTEASVSLSETIEDSDHELHIPALCDVEIVAALRRALVSRVLGESRADQAIEDYLDLPLTRHGHQWLLARILALRDNFSAYDATYVALAERLDGRLLTGDFGFARAARTHTEIAILPS
jgi:predicted nucleic acid-binding protein